MEALPQPRFTKRYALVTEEKSGGATYTPKILADFVAQQMVKAAGNAYIFHLNYRYAIDGEALENTARYINHSCEPNCEVDKKNGTLWIVAGQDIQAGEELTYNYGYDAQHYTNNPCHCRAANCCGYILDPQYWGVIKTR